MMIKLRFILLLLLLFIVKPLLAQQAAPMTKEQYRADFEELWKTVHDEYAYWHLKRTDWDSVKRFYLPQLDTVASRTQFISFLERVLRELYDHHAGLNTNTASSYRLVPSGADMKAVFKKGRVLVTAVRGGTGAARCGIQAGMEVITINGTPVAAVVDSLLPKCSKAPDSAARDYALQLALAGTHAVPRRLGIRGANIVREFLPDSEGSMDQYHSEGLLEARILSGNIGYVRIHNSLGDNDLIAAFDSVLNALTNTGGLILDLRETPGGGNSTVARAIMGRLITKEGPYQRHELASEEILYGVRRSWLELLSPRGKAYTGRVIVLAGPWTGSMGEGMTIGLHGIHRATIMGNPMAGLCGAIYSYRLTSSGIGFNIPAERLYHVNGTARERFAEMTFVAETPTGTDAVLEAARKALLRRPRR
jgi:C-terminal processing protease CtpA/Prc